MTVQLKNRIHALLAKNGLSSPVSDLFGKQGRAWIASLELRPVHQEILGRYLLLLDVLQADVKATTGAVAREARRDGRARLLMTIPGVGPLTAMVFLAETGDLDRFPEARSLRAATICSSVKRLRLISVLLSFFKTREDCNLEWYSFRGACHGKDCFPED